MVNKFLAFISFLINFICTDVLAKEVFFYNKNFKALDIDSRYYSTEVANYDLNDDGVKEFILKIICNKDNLCPRVYNPTGISYSIYNEEMFKKKSKNSKYNISMFSVGGVSNNGFFIKNTKSDGYYNIKIKCSTNKKEYMTLNYSKKYKNYLAIKYCK